MIVLAQPSYHEQWLLAQRRPNGELDDDRWTKLLEP
jgi:hypothetical protein